MNETQYRRWYTFSLRMAHRGWARLPRRSRKRVAGMVKDFFRELRSNDEWDHRRGTPGVISRIVDWDTTDNSGMPVDQYGHVPSGDLVCDMVSDWDEAWNPHFWEREEKNRKRWDELWGCRVRCCLRAGLDLASAPSAGVIGFEVCDLRRMYRGRIPGWINHGEWKDANGDPTDLNVGECAVGIWL